MSFFKNVYMALTDKRELNEPKIYYNGDETTSLINRLQQLAESGKPAIDQKKVENHLKLFSIGQSGEQNVLFELQHSLLPMVILHDVYIEYKHYKAQLDFIVITRQFILVLEVKKLFGNIHVTDRGDFQRVITKNNRVVSREGMYSPINQVERHVGILEKLLKENNLIKNCPITYAVTFANPKTILDISKNAPRTVHSHVIRHDQIKTYLTNEFKKNSPVSLPDQKVYAIADMILQYKIEKELNIEDYTLQNARAIEELPVQDETEQVAASLITKLPPSAEEDEPSENRERLKSELVNFRLQLAKQTNRKAFYIFTNQTLELLLVHRPQSLKDLLMIDGIGPKKVEEFGEDIVRIINEYGVMSERI